MTEPFRYDDRSLARKATMSFPDRQVACAPG
jgi:hypothetical protein